MSAKFNPSSWAANRFLCHHPPRGGIQLDYIWILSPFRFVHIISVGRHLPHISHAVQKINSRGGVSQSELLPPRRVACRPAGLACECSVVMSLSIGARYWTSQPFLLVLGICEAVASFYVTVSFPTHSLFPNPFLVHRHQIHGYARHLGARGRVRSMILLLSTSHGRQRIVCQQYNDKNSSPNYS